MFTVHDILLKKINKLVLWEAHAQILSRSTISKLQVCKDLLILISLSPSSFFSETETNSYSFYYNVKHQNYKKQTKEK